jgi:hypothetical protein
VRSALGRLRAPDAAAPQPAPRRTDPRAQDEAGLVQMKKPSAGSIP